jgi:hypothetical protein
MVDTVHRATDDVSASLSQDSQVLTLLIHPREIVEQHGQARTGSTQLDCNAMARWQAGLDVLGRQQAWDPRAANGPHERVPLSCKVVNSISVRWARGANASSLPKR